MTFQLAVCAEMAFTDLPIVERAKRIHDLGFAAEIWSWHGDNKRVGLLVEQLRLLPNRAAFLSVLSHVRPSAS